MAGFDDSNDIKINVSVDTKDAINAAKALGEAFSNASKIIGVNFKELSKAAKAFSQAQIAQIKANSNEEVALIRSKSAETVANIKKTSEEFRQGEENKRAEIVKTTAIEVQKLRESQSVFKQSQTTRRAEIEASYKQEIQGLQNTLAAIKESENTKRADLKATAALAIQNAKNEAREYKNASGERIATIRAESANYKAELQKDAKFFQQIEATKRAEIKKTIDNARLEAAKVRQATAEAQMAGVSRPTTDGGGVLSMAPQLAATVFLAEKLAQAIRLVAGAAFDLAESGNRVQALATAFSTLQQSVGRDPEKSILRLREATQGLISDTDLYQKANQAVLLGVPAKLFEESAEAAVKLGRAMGIDAVGALESLSIGLGRQSRLYLDNLGIVVSATEAYQNFARENGIVGRELTDAEKRLAFFNETSKQLRDGLSRLPPIQRDVGIAFAELRTSTENAKNQFLTAYNSSQELQSAFSQLNTLVKELEPTFVRVGQAVATLFARLLDFQKLPPIIQGIASSIGIAADKLDNFLVLSEPAKRSRFTELAAEIAEVEKRLSAKGFLKPFGGYKEELESDLKTLKAEYTSIGIELDLLDAKRKAQKEEKINLRINTEQLSADAVETQNTISKLKTSVEESLGLIKIPGLSAQALSAATPQLDAIFLQLEQGKLTAEQAGQAVEGFIKSFAVDISKTNLDLLNKKLKEAQDLLAADPNNEDKLVAVRTLEKQVELQGKSTALEQAQREQLIKLVEQRRKAQKQIVDENKKTTQELKKAQEQQAKAAIAAVKKQSAEWDQFLNQLKRETKTAIDPDIQVRLADIFRTTTAGSTEMIAKLQELGAEVQKRKGDLKALSKEAGDYLEVAQSGGPIGATAAKSKAEQQANDERIAQLQQIQQSMLNLREIFTGKKEGGGGFFGFDLQLGISPQSEAAIANSIQQSLSAAFSAAVDGFTRDDVPELAGAIGGSVGAAIGASIGGPAGGQAGAIIGTELGKIVGEALKTFGDDTQGTKERKKIDDYFANLFDGDRLGVVIEGEVFKATQKRKKGGLGRAIGTGLGIAASAVLPGISVAIGYGVGAIVDDAANQTSQALKEKIPPTFVQLGDLVFDGFTRFAGDVRFGVEEASKGFNAFSSYFETLPDNVRASFTGVGVAFGELLGVATEQSLLIGTALANNIGGSLQNLQILVMQSGESLEGLSEKIFKSFLDSKLSIQDAYNALLQLNGIFEKGIPGVVDYQQAIDNVVASFGRLGEAAKPGLMGVDSLRDIGTEAIQAGQSFDYIVNQLAQSFNFGANQVQLLFAALQSAGINSLQSLEGASETLLISILERIRQIREGIATTTEQVTAIPVLPEVKQPSAPRSSGAPKKSPEQEAREKLREETKKLLRESQAYLDILGKVTSGELAQAAAGLQIVQLQKEIEGLLKRRNDLEKKLNDELDKGSKANKQRLAKIAAELDGVNDKLEEFKKKAEGTTRVFKELDIKGVIPFIKSANSLGVIAKQIGVEFDKASSILVKGFLQGRLSLAELRAELDKTKETLGPGIPNAVGAVTDAFQNLIDAGTQGGQFSVDAFTDIFAEFREKFQTEGSALREAERKQLNENLRIAREALLGAVGPEATEKARKTLEQAKKTLDDFNASVAAPDLSDLRAQLEASFGREQIDKFFRALDESGLKTFEDFEKAGSASVVGILTKLESLGFSFNQTSQDIVDAQKQLIAAEKEANANLDPMQEAINLIKGLNEGAAQLPPVFNATTQAVESLNGPLGALASGFDDILEKVAKLKGPFETDVVFNISTIGDAGGKALVEALFGDGTGTTQDILSTTSGNSESNAAKIAKWKKEIADLKRKGLNDRRRNRIALLQNRIARLGG